MNQSLHTKFGTLATIIVGVAVIWGFVLAGSPGSARSSKFDDRRLEDLQMIRNEILYYVLGVDRMGPPTELKRAPPASLEMLRDEAVVQKPRIMDPETGELYGYRIVNPTTIELCATFHYERNVDWDPLWNHGPGRQCFTIPLLEPEGMKPMPVEPRPL